MNRRSWLTAGLAGGASLLALRLSASPPIRRRATGFGVPSESFLADLPRLMDLAAVPGLAMAVLPPRGRVWSMGTGLTGGDSPQPVSADTIFEAASLSKPVFAYLVMQLVRDGAIDLDRSLDSYLGRASVPGDARAGLVTARHVLSHSSGYRNWRFNDQQTLAPDFIPGTRFQYSGEGYYQLQLVVEAVTGRGINVLARDRVFTPLGMADSSYVWREAYEARYATAHRRGGDPQEPFSRRTGRQLLAQAAHAGKPLDDWRHEDVVAAFGRMTPPLPTRPVMLIPNVAGSLLTTANDYLRFVAAAAGAVGGPLDAPTLQSTYRRQTALRGALGWGLGWGVEEREGRTLIWHWGDNPGFKNFVMADPATGSAIVVLTNGDGGRAVYERVVRASAGWDPGALVWI